MTHLPPELHLFESIITTFVTDYSKQINNSQSKLDSTLTKLESMGYRLGQSIIERATFKGIIFLREITTKKFYHYFVF